MIANAKFYTGIDSEHGAGPGLCGAARAARGITTRPRALAGAHVHTVADAMTALLATRWPPQVRTRTHRYTVRCLYLCVHRAAKRVYTQPAVQTRVCMRV